MFNLMPRDKSFFDQLEQLSTHVVTASGALLKLIRDFPNTDGQLKTIEDADSAADDLGQKSLVHLDNAFITPLDREDIFHLINDLTDVTGTIAGVAWRFGKFKLESLDPSLTKQAELLSRITVALNEIIQRLRKHRKLTELSDRMQEVHQWEREADLVRREALGELLGSSGDAIDVMKRRELLDLLEAAIDACDDAVRTVQRVILKNS